MRLFKNKINSMLLCMMLIVAMAFTTAGCSDTKKNDDAGKATAATENSTTTEESTAAEESSQTSEKEVLGEGNVVFTFEVVDEDGTTTEFEIHTDKENVADALLEHELIAGDESDYGLYVKTVNGITVDYDTDGAYWAFYIDGEYASTGVDSTNVTDGAVYSFKVEK